MTNENQALFEIKEKRGAIRQIAMDLLYRLGGLKGQEIGNVFDVDYSTVSVSRKRLMKKIHVITKSLLGPS